MKDNNINRNYVKKGLIAIFVFVALILLGLSVIRSNWKNDVVNSRAIQSANGIETTEKVSIGGIDQYLNIRGTDKNNPVILFVHGGPGNVMMPFSHAFQNEWETDFTVVQWDQRNAGKTYFANDRALVAKTMSVDRMVKDLLEVTQYLRLRLNREKIFLVAHSWGSVMGTIAVKQRPELYQAYLGTGQVVAPWEADKYNYAKILEIANAKNNQEAISELKTISPFPNRNMEGLDVLGKWVDEFGGFYYGEENVALTMIGLLLRSPDYSLKELSYFFSMPPKEWFEEVMYSIDLNTLGYDFEVPMIYVMGEQELITPYPIVENYFKKIRSPYKKLVSFGNSAHMPMLSQPNKFAEVLKTELLPLASMEKKAKERIAL